ncbi:MAG: hypothetical protein JRF31_09900 [Deltaproteobacteria bacterium]|nr:hypothetical protein [Deltaproteobacteria bacterium]
MAYVAAVDEEIAANNFGFELDGVDIKRGPDRFRKGSHEVCLKGYNSRRLDDMAETLEANGYRYSVGDRFGLTYYSPDVKTRIQLQDDSIVRSEWSVITVIKGGLMEEELPVAEQEVISLFYDLELAK